MGDFNIPSNNTKYSDVPEDSNTPMSVSYSQTGVNSSQSDQGSTKERLRHVAHIAKKIGTTSFLELGMEAASAIKNADKKELTNNIKNGASKAADKASEITNSVKEDAKGAVDKFNDLDSSAKKKIIGGVASVALALSLLGGACSKNTENKIDSGYPTNLVSSTQTNSSQNTTTKTTNQTTTTGEAKKTDPNMNTETADSEHDGKISYTLYEYDSYNINDYVSCGEYTSQVKYTSDDTVDERKEASMNDLIELIAKRNEKNPTGTKFESIGDVFAREEDYHGRNALVDMIKKYGGYNNTVFKKVNVAQNDTGYRISHTGRYHYEELAKVDPNIVDGVLQITISNPNYDNFESEEFGGQYVIDIPGLFSGDENSKDNGGGHFYSGKIVCDHLPTEKELIQIIKDNHDIIFKTEDRLGRFSDTLRINQSTMNTIKHKKQKP